MDCAADIFLTCFALHNWLLGIDAFDIGWKEDFDTDFKKQSLFEVRQELYDDEYDNDDDDTNSSDKNVMTMNDTTVTSGTGVAASRGTENMQPGEDSGTTVVPRANAVP